VVTADLREHGNGYKDPETYAIIGAAMEVHRELGNGFLEAVYQDALEIEFRAQKISYEREFPVPISYKNRIVKTPYRADFLCHSEVIVELKAIKALGDGEVAQVFNYLKGANLQRALLINFGAGSLQYKRIVNQYNK